MVKSFLMIAQTSLDDPLETGEFEKITLYSCMKTYNFGNDENCQDLADSFDDEDEEAKTLFTYMKRGDVYKCKSKDCIFYPIFVYNHSGLSFSVTPFNDPWDSGLGIIARIDNDDMKKLGGEIKAFKHVKDLVHQLNRFETGTQLIVVEKDLETGDTINSCGGYECDLEVGACKDAMSKDLQHSYSDFEWELAIKYCKTF